MCLLEAASLTYCFVNGGGDGWRRKSWRNGCVSNNWFQSYPDTFINLAPETVEAWIIEALGQVASLLRFDIAALSVFTGRGTEGRVAYIWRAEGIPDIPSTLTDKDFPWSARELFAGRDVLSTNSGRAPTGSLH